MMISLFAGVTGLRNHQTKMDVIGNNIANVNTVGFKRSTVNFAEILSQTVSNAKAPDDNNGLGGTNPVQIGLGVKVASIDTVFTTGADQTTGRDSDISIGGDGMFMLDDGNNSYYSRAGNFGLDANGYLVASNGMKVQGWQATKKADGTTEIGAGTPISGIDIKLGETLPAKATSRVAYSGNLDANGGLEKLRITVDTDGNGTGTSKIDSEISFKYDAATDRWNWQVEGVDKSYTGLGTPPKVSGNGYFSLYGDGTIKESVTINSIKNDSNGTILLEVPTTGPITFKEKINPGNSVTSNYTTNTVVTSNQIYDSLGKQRTISLEYTKIDENIWRWETGESSGLDVKNGVGFLVFDAFGQIAGNHMFAQTSETDSTKFGQLEDADGNMIDSFPSATELGIAVDTSLKVSYLQEGEDPAANTSPYTVDGRGIIRYRGAQDLNGNGIPDADVYGNPIQEVTLQAMPEEGQIMNKSYAGSFSFDPAGEGGALPPDEGAATVKIQPDFNDVTQFSSPYGVKFAEQNGYGMGELENFKFTDNGDIMGEYSNGYKQVLGRIAVAKFFNPAGLQKVGGSLYMRTSNSGEAQVIRPGTSGAGKLSPGRLEMSNVDLALEFTEMIIAQRGFQASSKTIATADQLLQELINLKR